jgi:hypothetical protein
VRKRSFAPGILFLVIALALPALIIAQQNRSARRQHPTPASNRRSATARRAYGPAIKSDLAEALAVSSQTTSTAESSITTQSSSRRSAAC